MRWYDQHFRSYEFWKSTWLLKFSSRQNGTSWEIWTFDPNSNAILLMAKFDKSMKTILSGLGNRSIQFGQFQNRIKVRLEDLKTQVWFEAWKWKEKHQGANPCVDDQIWHFGKTRVSSFLNWNIHFYSYEMDNISKWMSNLYISQVGPDRHVSRVMHMFLEQFGWISLKKQRSASTNKNLNSYWIFEASMMKPSLRRSK
jgi:hypothetical protein